jgi:hypothetical protein
MHLFLYTIWFLLPLAFILMAVWGTLERLSKSGRQHDVGNYLRQAAFLLVAAGISLAIDRYVLIPHLEGQLPEWLPRGVIEVALFPVVLLVLASTVGPSKDIVIPPKSRRGGR